MDHIDYELIIEQARQMRAKELQRYQGLMGERILLVAKLLGGSLMSVLEWASEALRPLFSWNPKPY